MTRRSAARPDDDSLPAAGNGKASPTLVEKTGGAEDVALERTSGDEALKSRARDCVHKITLKAMRPTVTAIPERACAMPSDHRNTWDCTIREGEIFDSPVTRLVLCSDCSVSTTKS